MHTHNRRDALTPGLYTMPEAAKRLGVSAATAYELDNAGRFPVEVILVGAVRKVRVAELEHFLQGNAPAPAPAPGGRLADEEPALAAVGS